VTPQVYLLVLAVLALCVAAALQWGLRSGGARRLTVVAAVCVVVLELFALADWSQGTPRVVPLGLSIVLGAAPTLGAAAGTFALGSRRPVWLLVIVNAALWVSTALLVWYLLPYF
jgi:hypothetical protein